MNGDVTIEEVGTLVLNRAIWIKPGLEFRRIDGTKREYVSGNFEGLISLSNDTTLSLVVSEDILQDRPELFRKVE